MTRAFQGGSIRRLAERAGLGPPLRRAKRLLRGDPPPPAWKVRADLDDVAMRVLIAGLLAEDDSCIDVGAGLGDILADIVRLAPRGKHIAFEPVPFQSEIVRERFPTVDVRNAAASDSAGVTSFTFAKNYPAYSGFRPRDYPGDPGIETITVKTERIDDVVAESGTPPALIKIDVEGAEAQVLRGAMQTLREHRPMVVFEHGLSAREYGTTSAEIYELLCGEADLRIFDLDGNGPYTDDEFATAKYWNFVAHR